MNDRHLAYFRLVEAFRQPGCPVCRCVEEASRRYLDALVHEQVNDPDTRRRLRAAWGFCNAHTWMLADLGGARFGAAILHEDLLRVSGRRTERLGPAAARPARGPRAWLGRLAGRAVGAPALVRLHRRRPPCPACVETARAEARYVETQAAFAGELEFQRAWETSDGLCVPHAIQAIERAAGRPEAAELARLTARKWDALRRTLARFISKHDYRNAEPLSAEEAASCRRALATIAGEPGIIRHDRRRSRPEPPPRRDRRAGPPASDGPPPGDRQEFERRKLELRVRELAEQLGEASSRAAALHYRLSRVAEDRNVLELNLSGERAANQLAERVLDDLRRENERLRAELSALRAPGAPR